MRIRKREQKVARIEMLPLIDIVFLLLVFFIYAMLSMAVHNGLQLDLPNSSQATQTKESPLSLSIKKEGGVLQVYLNKEAITLEKLPQRLINVQQGLDKKPLLLFAEKNISYQELFQVLDILKKNAIEDVSLQATRE